ncbi:Pfam:DUF124 [Seminavis robusta]|uniref:Pfam:DUF124 n=1 Tax=Seminavis robusta TaxID=568900 RepID=A0A9N8E0F2_9STRA|nr:Pfam:DUF124 [Seminavis robusta]|eukprot:Sro495_g154460.1 Pfam:DUF124 (475) ;mRNA; r:26486-27996
MIRSSVGLLLRRSSRRSLQRRLHRSKEPAAIVAKQYFSSDDKPKPPSVTSSELAPISGDNLPAKLIDFQASSKIEGEESHIATVHLAPGETLRAESGAMLFMTQGIVMDTNLSGASSAFSRMMTGQNMFLTDFRYEGKEGTGTVGLGTDFPSKIMRFSLEEFEHSSLICQRGAFLASNPTVNIEMEYTKSLTAGFFGGQGFILQRLTGQGDVLIKGGGTIVCKELEEGESLRVTSGSIVCFEPTVEYDVQMMPGVKNVMFGGEGLFVTNLTGPGRVWLQGMPADRMIAEIARRVPAGGPGIGIPIGIGGSGGGAEGAAGADDAAVDGVGGGEEMVAASDAAIEADRQATVATSGAMPSDDIDADSQSALFGDAAPEDSSPSGTDGDSSPTPSTDEDFGDAAWASSEEPQFDDSTDSFSTTSDEPTFSDSGFFEDSTTTEGLGESAAEAASEAASETGGGILSTLWGIFSPFGDD